MPVGEFADEANDRGGALRRRVADRVADAQAPRAEFDRGAVERLDRLRAGARGVLGHVHDRQVVPLRERQRVAGVLQHAVERPVLGVLADVAAADERADLDRHAGLLRHLDDRFDVGHDGAAGDVGADPQLLGDDVPGHAQDVLARPAAGTRQTEVGGVDAEFVHQLEQLELLLDGRVADRRGLQTVAERLVVELQGAGGPERASLVPVVNQFRDASHGERLCRRGPAAQPRSGSPASGRGARPA